MMSDYEQVLSRIKDILTKNPNGMSVTEISKALGKNKNTIGRYLDILLISGQVDMRTYGMAKVYTLSQRVPLSAMLSFSSELIIVLDDDSRIVDLNDNFLGLIHLPRHDVVGKSITHLNPPDIDVDELLGALSSGRREQEHMVTFRMKNEKEQIFRQKSVPTVFNDGKKGITIILEDITARVLAEREIRISEERFRSMAENIQDGIIIMEDGRPVFVNRRISEISGYSFEELRAIPPLSIVAPEDRNQAADQIRLMEEGARDAGTLEMWIIRKDGERRFVYGRITSIRDTATRYTFIIFTDITELKAKEVALLRSEQRFRTMAENIQDGLVIIEDGRCVYANRRISEITGYPLEELKHKGFLKIIAEDEREKIRKITSTDCAGTAGEATFWIQRKDGRRRCLFSRITAAAYGSVRTTYITMTDITDAVEREQALRDRIAALQNLIS